MVSKNVSSNEEVIVIGSDHHNTLGVIESLGMAGLLPYCIIDSKRDPSHCYVLKSKYCKGRGYTTSTDHLIELLHDLFDKKSSLKSIVIPTNDSVAALLDNHYDELSDFLILPGTGKQGELEFWMNKINMIELAKTVGMNVPRTQIVKKGETIDDFVFPCMTKSISTLNGGKSNIRICHNKEELNLFLSKQTKYAGVQVQQLIDKDFEYQFIGCSINAGDEIIIPGRTHIVRPNGYDNTFYLEYVELDNSFSKSVLQAKDFIRKTRYSGLFSIEFIRDSNGVDFFLEMNFRNDGNAMCVSTSGTNLPYIWYLSCTRDEDCKEELQKSSFKPVIHTPLVPYFYYMAAGEVPFCEWLRNNFKTTQFETYFKGDTAPFWYHLWLERKDLYRAFVYKLFNAIKLRHK